MNTGERNWTHEVPAKGRRIVMLTPETMIDRRIVGEASALQEKGYEVYILAASDATTHDRFFFDCGIPVERVDFVETRKKRLPVLEMLRIAGRKILPSRLVDFLHLNVTRVYGVLSGVTNFEYAYISRVSSYQPDIV